MTRYFSRARSLLHAALVDSGASSIATFAVALLLGCGAGSAGSGPVQTSAGASDIGGGNAASGSAMGGSSSAGSAAGGAAGTSSSGGGAGAGLSSTGGAGASSVGGGGGGGGAGGGAASPSAAQYCPPGPYAASPLPQNPAVQTLCTDLSFSEGPVWLASRGELLFSNFDSMDSVHGFPGGIMTYSPGGSCKSFLSDAGTNGLSLTLQGKILAAKQVTHTLSLIDPDTKAITVLATGYQGTPFNSPNDAISRSDGNIYFTDPAWITRPLPHALYRRDPSGVLTALPYPNRHPNGIALSLDEKQLYLSLDTPNQVLVFDVAADGALGNPRPFSDDTSDGMVLDCAGNVYFTGSGSVRIYSPAGKLLGTIMLPDVMVPDPTNLAFGGPAHKTLYITGSNRLRAVELEIPGYPY